MVPTMGALHDGHLELIRVAAEHGDDVVVSIFVNPLQFDRPDDFAAYPRPIDDDVATCRDAGVQAVYAPTAAAMYPDGLRDRRRTRRHRRAAGGRRPSRPLPRRVHRGAQAVQRRAT